MSVARGVLGQAFIFAGLLLWRAAGPLRIQHFAVALALDSALVLRLLSAVMPVPIVAIAIALSTGGAPVEGLPTVVASCSRALGDDRCVSDLDTRSLATKYVALIKMQSANGVQIDLRLRAGGVVRHRRQLAFQAAGLGTDQWNAVGLVVAALVADESQCPATPTSAMARKECPCPLDAAPQAMASREVSLGEPWIRVGLGAAFAQGFEFDPWRVGPALHGSLGPRGSAAYAVWESRWQYSRGKLRSDALDVALGLGVHLVGVGRRFQLDVQGSAVAEALLVSAGRGAASPTESFRARFGGRLGLVASLRLRAPLWCYLSAEGSWLAPRALVLKDGTPLGAEPNFRPGIQVGLSLTW